MQHTAFMQFLHAEGWKHLKQIEGENHGMCMALQLICSPGTGNL
jgi:hypothetical protein